VRGVVHIGAHKCEERYDYHNELHLGDEKIFWIEAIPDLCTSIQASYPTIKIVNAVVSDRDGDKIDFNVTNNGQSSSMFDLDLHKIHHPNIHYVSNFRASTKTVETIYKEQGLAVDFANFYNLDI